MYLLFYLLLQENPIHRFAAGLRLIDRTHLTCGPKKETSPGLILGDDPFRKAVKAAQTHKPDLLFSGDSSDDSYLSADEEPAEGPKFERPLGDVTASSGTEVTLKCIITGSPSPTGTTENVL